ncbi:hypothetical protein NEUTE1DRAFT_121728 [Neurospora tetrasperma FGSC 2508]|uniref:Uncharacterized protein n=1 Tax=Neurospora tetrasperma (strain FGSC 2508 / ATCC MYA-4615 / P0657) TaxID=510951 RepID=F8MN49_NEUT8|nr:uncharacterized protein NEUTE1DRAFT_121728 [Neurospora tetrasperma FGSC 2508]EGO57222.1 hypothetical protein NEUTE1DRAFT_121728 [Neurospora tetrasperma FGSC 2508]EGZ72533.1 hypothetical protein NEUTE2DRAFT_158461 [Neurospora tetrasperma FGSC 2509]
MPVKFAISSGALSLALLLFGHGNPCLAETTPDTSYIYFDNTQYLAASSNVVPMSWSTLEAAFASPNRSDIASFTGLDWTKPYPGSPLPGFTAHLRIADEVRFPPAVTDENVSTNVAALNFGIPSSIRKENGLPRSMHSSWYVCQHYYISTLPDPTSDIAHDCSFLPSQCQKDLIASLTQNWGAFKSNPDSNTMCSGWALDTITESCQSTLGRVKADILGFEASDLGDEDAARSFAVDEVGRLSWMVGTNFNDPGNQTSYAAAYNRTYIVATVFGYNSGYTGSVKPVVELACLRGQWGTTQATSSSSSSSTPPDSSSVISTTSSASAISGSSTAVSSATRASSSSLITDFQQNYYFHCIALLHYALHSHGLDSACICTHVQSAAAAVAAPTQLLCETSEDKRYARARNARLIMSNEVPDMPTDDVKPYCFWHPDTAKEETYRLLATRYPDMAYSVGRACAVAGYDGLYHELDILPEISIAEEARESSAANAGSKAIYEHIMKQPICYAVLNDYTRFVHHQNPRSPAFMNGDTAVRSTLDVTVTPRDVPDWCDTRHFFDIAEDYHVAEVTTHKYFFTSQGTLPPEHVELLYSPLPSHLPTIIKDPLIVMAAYEGNLDRYVRLRRPCMVEQEHGAVLRGIYHNTTFAKWWSLQGDKCDFDIRAATLARFIMVNDLSHITETDPHPEDDSDEIPGMIWWPLIPAERTLKALAKRRPDMHLQVAMACIAGNYKKLWDELAPEPCYQLYNQASLKRDPSVRNHFVDYLERRASELGSDVKRFRAVCENLAHDWCLNATRLDKEPTSCWLPSEISIPGPSGFPDTDNVYGSPDQTNLAGEDSNWELYICSSEEVRAKIPASRSEIRLYDSDDE